MKNHEYFIFSESVQTEERKIALRLSLNLIKIDFFYNIKHTYRNA